LAGLARLGRFIRARGPGGWPDGTLAHRFAFIHALYQQVLYTAIPAARTREWHGTDRRLPRGCLRGERLRDRSGAADALRASARHDRRPPVLPAGRRDSTRPYGPPRGDLAPVAGAGPGGGTARRAGARPGGARHPRAPPGSWRTATQHPRWSGRTSMRWRPAGDSGFRRSYPGSCRGCGTSGSFVGTWPAPTRSPGSSWRAPGGAATLCCSLALTLRSARRASIGPACLRRAGISPAPSRSRAVTPQARGGGRTRGWQPTRAGDCGWPAIPIAPVTLAREALAQAGALGHPHNRAFALGFGAFLAQFCGEDALVAARDRTAGPLPRVRDPRTGSAGVSCWKGGCSRDRDG
jgi:hypothetical protein